MIPFTIGKPIKKKKTITNAKVIGLVKKIDRLPFEIIKAFLMLDSSSFANTKERIIGDVGNSAFFKK
jgi:Txe/YoeB family toxin of Txe-Axe toxin-antitoxin module